MKQAIKIKSGGVAIRQSSICSPFSGMTAFVPAGNGAENREAGRRCIAAVK